MAEDDMSSLPPLPTMARKIGSKRACESCRVRKVRCSGAAPCSGCLTAGVSCTFRIPLVRGPRSLRAKTLHLIAERQSEDEEMRVGGEGSQRAGRKALSGGQDNLHGTPLPGQHPQYAASAKQQNLSINQVISPSASSPPEISALVFCLCVYRLRLFPLWPIVKVELVISALHRMGSGGEARRRGYGELSEENYENEIDVTNDFNTTAYTLANAIGAATAAQLKLGPTEAGGVDAAVMAAECETSLARRRHRLQPTLDSVRIAFFLHVYHENKAPGGACSLLYLREAVSLAQILGLQRSGEAMGQRILALLYVTERGVALLHGLPVVLQYDIRRLRVDDFNDATQILPGFRRLVGLFWMLDRAGAFDVLAGQGGMSEPELEPGPESEPDVGPIISGPTFGLGPGPSPGPGLRARASHTPPLALLQHQLGQIPLDGTDGCSNSSDVQMADICVTRQWMLAVLWRAVRAARKKNDRERRQLGYNLGDDYGDMHPVQIARKFLHAIGRLPSEAVEAHGPAMEYKIYDIARTVVDAVADATAAGAADMRIATALDVLTKLQRLLMLCRGGNKTLLELLGARISELGIGGGGLGSIRLTGFPEPSGDNYGSGESNENLTNPQWLLPEPPPMDLSYPLDLSAPDLSAFWESAGSLLGPF